MTNGARAQSALLRRRLVIDQLRCAQPAPHLPLAVAPHSHKVTPSPPSVRNRARETMAESSDAGEIKAIGAGVANQLIGTMDCAVNLLPEFRAAALSQFTSAAKGTQHLLALTEPGAAGPSGMILYSVEKGRRNTTTLSCRLLLVSGRTKTHVARALIDHSISQHSANRMEAQVTNHNPNPNP